MLDTYEFAFIELQNIVFYQIKYWRIINIIISIVRAYTCTYILIYVYKILWNI